MNPTVANLYQKYRQHQRNVQTAGGGTLTTYPDGRTELSYASAPYGEHAVSALAQARRAAAWRPQ